MKVIMKLRDIAKTLNMMYNHHHYNEIFSVFTVHFRKCHMEYKWSILLITKIMQIVHLSYHTILFFQLVEK